MAGPSRHSQVQGYTQESILQSTVVKGKRPIKVSEKAKYVHDLDLIRMLLITS